MQDKLLSIREVSEIMGFSYSKVYRLAREQTLPFRQFGAAWVIPKSVLYRELGLEFD